MNLYFPSALVNDTLAGNVPNADAAMMLQAEMCRALMTLSQQIAELNTVIASGQAQSSTAMSTLLAELAARPR